MRTPSAATVIATLALFVALGGTGYAAIALEPNSVGSAQIKENAVQSSDIRDGSINGAADIKNGSISVSDLSKGALKGLDGKDGKDGKTGAQGPAGPAGASGSGGGGEGLAVEDANGTPIVNAYNPTVNWVTGTVSRFYLYKNGTVYEANDTTGVVAEYARTSNIYMVTDCTSPNNNDTWIEASLLDYPHQLIRNPMPSFGSPYFRAGDATRALATDLAMISTHPMCRPGYIDEAGGLLVKLNPVPAPTPLATFSVPFRVVVEDTTHGSVG